MCFLTQRGQTAWHDLKSVRHATIAFRLILSMIPSLKTLHGDCRDVLRQVPDGSVHCCVTSPPYWGLRSYLPKDHPDKAREIGQEKTPELFVQTMVEVFREVRRCLHDSGVLFLNLGDSYASTPPGNTTKGVSAASTLHGVNGDSGAYRETLAHSVQTKRNTVVAGLKPKDLCGIPWRVVLALQADGWYWRSCIVWHKKSCMPESVTDRPTNSWEPIFLLAKSQSYFMDMEAVKEPAEQSTNERDAYKRLGYAKETRDGFVNHLGEGMGDKRDCGGMRNQRNVWSLGPEPYSEAHFATFPTEIPRRAILAGTSARGCCPKCGTPWTRCVETTSHAKREGNGGNPSSMRSGKNADASLTLSGRSGVYAESRTVGWQPGCKCNAGEPIPCTVLDPFGGSGTTGMVALELGRNATLCELNDGYLPLIQKRTHVTPGFTF